MYVHNMPPMFLKNFRFYFIGHFKTAKVLFKGQWADIQSYIKKNVQQRAVSISKFIWIFIQQRKILMTLISLDQKLIKKYMIYICSCFIIF